MSNRDRAETAEEAIIAFTDYGAEPPGELRTYVGDMLVNMMHLCHQRHIDFNECAGVARVHFECELQEDDESA